MPIDRRKFLTYSAALGAMQLPHAVRAAEPRASRRTTSDRPQLRVLMKEADGSPLDSDRAKTLMARDLPNDPLPQKAVYAPGRARIDLPSEPMQVSLRLKVPGFGEVYCWADNDGKGYTTPGNIEFVIDAAATRLRRVREALELARREAAEIDRHTERYLEAAAQPVTDVPTAYASLAAGLHAGEGIALARAYNRIARFTKPRKDFLFGCLVGASYGLGPTYESLLLDRFNYGAVSWYGWRSEPSSQPIDYTRMDASVDWCLNHNMTPKGYGYCFMAQGATSEWLRKLSYGKIFPVYKRVVEQTMRRYARKVSIAEIINEAHDKANYWDFTQAQILELTKAVCKAARQGSPHVKRQINHCCPWGEYAKSKNPDGSRRWSPYRYLADCVSHGVEFESIGLQVYYPQCDLLEIERMLDRFRKFNRPIQITEIATASAEGPDPNCMRDRPAHPGWHGPWTEETQADWLEAMYTLIYSKPEFESVGWWDVADVKGHFWPYGGLLNADLTPKLSYHRLGELQRNWGVAPRGKYS